jgi:hypothetical protein
VFWALTFGVRSREFWRRQRADHPLINVASAARPSQLPLNRRALWILRNYLYRERVLRARATPIDQKFLAGAELFEYACRVTCDGIRHQNPGIDEEHVQRILRERRALARRLERGS